MSMPLASAWACSESRLFCSRFKTISGILTSTPKLNHKAQRSKLLKARTTLLIDGDVYAYQAAAATERVVSFDGDNYSRVGSLAEAIPVFESKLGAALGRFKTRQYVIALSDVHNFRKELLPGYKAHRDERNKPLALEELREYVREKHRTYRRPGLEADDVLGILATSRRIIPDSRRVIVSIDKDMRSVPGEFYDSKHDRLYSTSPEEAAYWHMTQTLTGDAADGYKGCPGVGPKTAAKLLEGLSGYAALWPAVVKAYAKAGLEEEAALVQARMARILQVGDYDFKNKQVKLWKP